MDLKLNAAGDVDVTADQITLVDGLDAIAQDLRCRLKFFQGEWFLDVRVGMPYFQRLLGQKTAMNVVTDIFRQAIQSTPGVKNVIDLNVAFDSGSRTIGVYFRADTVAGPLTYNEESILP